MEYNGHKLRKELERDEGVKNRPYTCSAGKLTIGIGHNLEANGIPDIAIDVIYEADVEALEGGFDDAFPWWRDMTDARQRALLNMGFNLGVPRLSKFRDMLQALEDGRWNDAAAEALASRWATQVHERAVRIAAMFKEG